MESEWGLQLIASLSIVHVLMRDEKEGMKKQARSTNNKAKQHSTPKAVTFPKKNELPRVGLNVYIVQVENTAHTESCE